MPTDRYDLRSLKYAICGAAPLLKELVLEFERRIGLRLVEGYGLTEAFCIVTVAPVNGERIAGSIGLHALPGCAYCGAGPCHWSVSALGRGEREQYHCVCGENVFGGYLQAEHNHNI